MTKYSPREYNGITEDKILNETDIETLLSWKEELDGVGMDIELQLNNAKAKRDKGESYDIDWFYRAKGKKSVLGYLSQIIQNTLGIVKANRKKERDSKREVLFIRACKEVLKKEVYDSIWEKVNLPEAEERQE